MTLVRNAKTIKWFGAWVNDYHGTDAAFNFGIKPEDYGKCDHAIEIPNDPNAWSIGLVNQGNDKYKIYFDFWGSEGRKLVDKIGRHGEKLHQQYVKAKVTKELKTKGFTLTKNEDLANGNVKLTLQGKLSL
jgi:hypothetical protein